MLDAPCGYGRHSIVLARAGYRVIGVDRSPVLLDEARRRAGDGEWPQWVQADHRELPFEDASFDAALNLFSALGYRGEDGDRRTLGELRRVLRPGGALVVETMHRDRLMHIYQQRSWDPLPDGGLLLEERTFDYVAGEIETTHSLVEAGGNRESHDVPLPRLHGDRARAARRGGRLPDVECFGGWDREELSRETRLVLVAKAP